MIPGSFDPATAREIVGDAQAREIESKAITDAAMTWDLWQVLNGQRSDIQSAPDTPFPKKELVGDAQAREIESKARTDADSGNFDPPRNEDKGYWGGVRAAMEHVLYREQYSKRLARIARKAEEKK